jgi:hypothetical protein
MPDKQILFTGRATYTTLAGTTVYEAGQVETMRDDMAARWVSRGVATDDVDVIAKATAPPPPPPTAEAPPAADVENEAPPTPPSPKPRSARV